MILAYDACAIQVINSSKLAVKAVKGLKKNFDMATRSISDDAKKAAGKEKVRESEKRLRVVEDELKRAELFLTDDRCKLVQGLWRGIVEARLSAF